MRTDVKIIRVVMKGRGVTTIRMIKMRRNWTWTKERIIVNSNENTRRGEVVKDLRRGIQKIIRVDIVRIIWGRASWVRMTKKTWTIKKGIRRCKMKMNRRPVKIWGRDDKARTTQVRRRSFMIVRRGGIVIDRIWRVTLTRIILEYIFWVI